MESGYKLSDSELTQVISILEPSLMEGETLELVVRGKSTEHKTDIHAVTDLRVINLSLKEPTRPLVSWNLDEFESIAEVKTLSVLIRRWDGSSVNIGWLDNRVRDEKLFVERTNSAIQSQRTYSERAKRIAEREVRQIGNKFPDETGRITARRIDPFLRDDEIVLFACSFVGQKGIDGDLLILTQNRIMVFASQKSGESFATSNEFANLAKFTLTGGTLAITDNLGNVLVLGRLRHEKQDSGAVQEILRTHVTGPPTKKKVPVTAGESMSPIPPSTPTLNDELVQSASDSTFDIQLDAVIKDKIKVIKCVRSQAGLGLREAKNLVESAPVVIFRDVPRARASILATDLENAGAQISLIPKIIQSTEAPTNSNSAAKINSGAVIDSSQFKIGEIRIPDMNQVPKQALSVSGLPDTLPDPIPSGFVLGDFGSVIDQPSGAEGAFGRIYRVRRAFDDRILAGKLYLRGSSGAYSDLADQQIRREVEALESLSHPSIMRIFGPIPVTTKGEWMILSEWIDGSDLIPYTDGSIEVPGEKIFDIGCQLISGIEYLESVGVVHRDLKPANIMLTANGQLKIIDFNLARENGQITTIAGTELYMPPDLFYVTSSIDTFVDRYAVGVILFELLLKEHPYIEYYRKNIPIKATSKPLTPSRVRSDVSQNLGAFLEAATNSQEINRFATAQQMFTAWQSLENDIKAMRSRTNNFDSQPPAERHNLGPRKNVDQEAAGLSNFCTNCGAGRKPSQKFCEQCGTVLT